MRNDHTTPIRYASGIMMLLGAYLALSPIFIVVTGAAFWTQIIAGAALFGFGASQISAESTLPSWLNGLVGLAMVGSAYFFGLSGTAFWNEIIVGVAAVLMATYDGYEVATHGHATLPT